MGLSLGIGLGLNALLGMAAPPYTTNLRLSNTSNFRNAWLANSGNVAISNQGDSTARGVDEGAIPYNIQYNVNDVCYRLSNALNGAGIVAGSENWFGLSGTSLNDYIIRDGRWTVSGGTVNGSNKYQGGTEIRFPSVASGASYTLATPSDKFDLYWVNQGVTGRTFSYSIDGGTAVNVTTSGVNAMQKISGISLGSLGIHTIAFNWVAGTTLLIGLDCYNSTRNQISVWQHGISGGVSANMIDDGGTPGAGRITQLTDFPPKLVLTEMGIVNDWRTSVPVATSQANCTTFINAMKAINTDVILVIPPWDNGTGTGNTANQSQYTAAMYAAAAAANIPVIDIRLRWTSYAYAVSQGWQRSTDNVHPAAAGYNDEANNIFLPAIKRILQGNLPA